MSVYSSFSEQELIALLREGDHAAYTEIYQRYYRLLFVHAYKRLRDEEQAKDIIQEFFTRLWDKRELLFLKSSLSGYFFTSVNNRIVDYFLSKDVQSKYITSFAGFLDGDSGKADHLVREKQLTMLIDKEIQELPPKMREIFELSRKKNLSHKEIAEQLSISEKTVDRQISNALQRLRIRLGLFVFLVFLLNI